MPRATTKPRPICPGCGKHCGRHKCKACRYESDIGKIPTAREIVEGTEVRAEWNDVDIGLYVRAVLADLKAGA